MTKLKTKYELQPYIHHFLPLFPISPFVWLQQTFKARSGAHSAPVTSVPVFPTSSAKRRTQVAAFFCTTLENAGAKLTTPMETVSKIDANIQNPFILKPQKPSNQNSSDFVMVMETTIAHEDPNSSTSCKQWRIRGKISASTTTSAKSTFREIQVKRRRFCWTGWGR